MESTVQFPTDPDKVMLVGDWHRNTFRVLHMLDIAAREGVSHVPGLRDGEFPAHEIRRADEHRAVLGRVVDKVSPLMLFHGHYHFRYESRRPRPEGGHTHIVGLAHDRARYTENYVMLDLGKEN